MKGMRKKKYNLDKIVLNIFFPFSNCCKLKCKVKIS